MSSALNARLTRYADGVTAVDVEYVRPGIAAAHIIEHEHHAAFVDTGTTHSVGVRLNYILLKEAARKGAQAIVTVCPLCQYNLDAYQAEIRRATGEPLEMPVLYFTQVLGWALGGDTGALGLGRAISGRKAIGQWFPKHEMEKEAYV